MDASVQFKFKNLLIEWFHAHAFTNLLFSMQSVRRYRGEQMFIIIIVNDDALPPHSHSFAASTNDGFAI